MERIDPAIGVPPHLADAALALGNFDGVHIGHQAVIRTAVAHAHAAGRPALVATFEPHPSRLFRPDAPPFALTSTSQKLEIFAGLGVDGAVVLPFDAAMAALSAAAFAEEWLGRKLRVSHVVTGMDFHFGKGRSGHAQDLPALGLHLGFTAQAIGAVENGSETISSTRIREMLRAGNPREAASLLSRPFTIRGPVIAGAQLGRTIGIPTANQKLGAYLRPRFGVYAVHAVLPDGSVQDGVANLGIRPMFDMPDELLESWMFDWSGDLYDQDIDVQLIEWLRPELKLGSLEELKAQVALDAVQAREALSRRRG